MISSHRKARFAVPAIALSAGLVLSACASTEDSSNGGGEGGGDAAASGDGIIIGTTDKITKLDPAGSYDNGTSQVARQVYGYLLESEPGAEDGTPVPSLAESAEF